MAEELRVILKAKELAKHTLIITSNCNRYPKKYRFSLVDKMQNKALEIYEHLYEANRTDLRLYPKERSELQTKAITKCDELLFYIELSMELNIINNKSTEYWSKMVSDIKHMAIAWRTKDKER
nr:MAG TPA_asm: Avd-like protein [Bacteriophage sp.]DAT56728.1 MAG TPA: Avd-like protein [Bacteriophage sp.]DAX22191.1 MAG TPA: Avd-like protein [Bacteriophage sp.]